MEWKIIYYETASKREPVKEFIDGLQEKARAKAYNTLELLAEFGPMIRSPHAKKIAATPLWELRVLGESSLRFFYVARIEKTFLLLHGFTKRKQKTPSKDIKTAMERLHEYNSRP